ncbi:MAG: 3-isopropylmalate dehydrogenase [Planctomycetes bacterium]|nr:3-isopropylmalate dehydrogenase [Planctomycetota bacterium]
MKTYKIAVIPGDGIGAEVVNEGIKVLKTLEDLLKFKAELINYPFGADHYLKTGEIFNQKDFEFIKNNSDAILLGAIGDPRIEPGLLEFGIVGKLRFELDLYANVRPIKVYSEHLLPLKNKKPEDLDILVIRENTEDCYRGKTIVENEGKESERHVQEMFYTKNGTERVIRYAFQMAMKRKKKLTLVDKRNAIKAHEIYRKTFVKLSREFPQVEIDYAYVDAFCMWLIKKPEYFDTVVTTNLFGDIVTDLGAALQGGMGIAAGANIHPGKVSMFEPIHGSAPKYKNLKKASPLACILATAWMLDHVGETKALPLVENAIKDLFKEKKIDAATTESAIRTDVQGDLVCKKIESILHN